MDKKAAAAPHLTELHETVHQLAWKVDRNHVYPANDLREHLLINCWCGPADDDGIVVHNSLDGRELYERGNRKVS